MKLQILYAHVILFVCMIISCQQKSSNMNNDASLNRIDENLVNPFNDFPLLLPPIVFDQQMLKSMNTKPKINTNFAQKYLGINQPNLALYAIGRINMADTVIALIYGQINSPNQKSIKLTWRNRQNNSMITYILAQQQYDKTITATLNRQLEITTRRQYNQKNATKTTLDSTIFQTYVLGEPVYTIPIDTVFMGDINNDKVDDYAYIIPPIIRVPYNENPDFIICEPEPCQLQVKFSVSQLKPLQHFDAFAAQIQTIGDLNNDGIQEIALVQGKNWSSWRDLFVYTYQLQNNKNWKMLDSIRTFELDEKLINHIEKTSNFEFKLIGQKFNEKTGLFKKITKYVRF